MKAREIIPESLTIQRPDQALVGSAGGQEATTKISKTLKSHLQTHCQPWLEIGADHGILYRGLAHWRVQSRYGADGVPLVFTSPIRQDRRPRDSGWSTHEFFNHVIGLAGGVANRSNCAFVSPSPSEAKEYGTVYVVIPVGQFNYTWSSEVKDWYSNEMKVRSWWSPERVLENVSVDLLHRVLKEDLNMPTAPGDELKALGRIRRGHWQPAGRLAFQMNLKHECYTAGSIGSKIKADRGIELAMNLRHEIMIHAQEMLYVDHRLVEDMLRWGVTPW